MRLLNLKYLFSFKTLTIFIISVLVAYLSYSYGIYLSYRYFLTIEVISADNSLARDKKVLEIINRDNNADAVKLVENYIDSNEDTLGYVINNYNSYNYLYSLANGLCLFTLLDRESIERADRISKRHRGQVESAGKSRQRVRGESPRIVKDSDQLWPPSHASATRKGAAKR